MPSSNWAFEDGIIVTRTDSLGAGLTQQIAVSHKPATSRQVQQLPGLRGSDSRQHQQWRCHHQPQRQDDASEALSSNLYQFRAGTEKIAACSTASRRCRTVRPAVDRDEKPHIEQIAKMVDRIREVIPNAKLAYNNSPSFNWTLNFRWQVYDAMEGSRQGCQASTIGPS